jgi:hypothetical protein
MTPLPKLQYFRNHSERLGHSKVGITLDLCSFACDAGDAGRCCGPSRQRVANRHAKASAEDYSVAKG